MIENKEKKLRTKKRGKPSKVRIIQNQPRILQFSPRGRPGRPDESVLKIEEFEALRLFDCLGLDQQECSKHMGVSQQTFSRVLRSAHKTLSDAIVHGKAIKIYGGSFYLQKSY